MHILSHPGHGISNSCKSLCLDGNGISNSTLHDIYITTLISCKDV